jgi:hypothetical protein
MLELWLAMLHIHTQLIPCHSTTANRYSTHSTPTHKQRSLQWQPRKSSWFHVSKKYSNMQYQQPAAHAQQQHGYSVAV